MWGWSMPRPKSYTTVGIRKETVELLRRVSQRIGLTYDEILKMLLESYEVLLDCRARFDEFVGDVTLECGDEDVSIDIREYKRLRRILKFLPKPEKQQQSWKVLPF